MRRLLAGLAVCAVLGCATASKALATDAPAPALPFARFVDQYLDQFARFHPSIAAGNGLHQHDAELEDFSAHSVAREIRWLKAERRVLAQFDLGKLTRDERVDLRILAGIVDGWLLDLAEVRTWQRNPMIYVAALSDGVHDLISMESAPPALRMRRIEEKLQGVPRLIAAARVNVQAPPRVFVERAIAMLGGVADLLSHDVPLAFAGADAGARDRLMKQTALAQAQLSAWRQDLVSRVLPAASGSYRVGIANVEARYRAEELIDTPAAELLKIGQRELALEQAEFVATAAKVDAARSAAEVWRDVQEDHPARGELVPAAGRVVDELFAFVAAHHLMSLPPNQHIIVAPAPVYDLGLASMHSSPPLEAVALQSYYYITDANADWPAERQSQWLRTFNYATLADISAHEVVPGHYAHSLFMRGTPGKVRRIWVGLNPFPQPSSGQDGWAHYAERMVSEEGFKADDPRYRLAQINESIKRICRLIAGIKLHSGEWDLPQAIELFEHEGRMPEASAEREAVRGTYDPTYGGYFLGKLAAFKLRRDYQKAQGAAYTLQDFNERVMHNGIAPWWAHRQLLLPGDGGAVLE